MAAVIRKAACLLLAPALFASPIAAITLDVNDQKSIKSAAATVAAELQSLYTGDQDAALLGKFPYPPYYWWESGAAWGAMVNYWHYTGDDTYNEVTRAALVSQLSPTNDFMPEAEIFNLGNDDQAFWAFAAMAAAEYDFPAPPSPYPSWLSICENVFNDFVIRWQDSSSTCAGGLKWQIYPQNNGYTYKNAISNGGFFQLSARLARMTGNQTYFDWATKVWDWTNAVGFMDTSYHVYDGSDETGNCATLNHYQWTYNVGVFMYGAAVLQNYTNGDATWVKHTAGLLNTASIFTSPYPNATDVLFEAQCETNNVCNTDQISMKGYLARWLAGTSIMAPFTAGEVGTVLRASAAAAAKSCTGGTGGSTCGFKWYTGGWDGTQGLGQQLVALESMYTLLVNDTAAPKIGQDSATATSSQEPATSSPTSISSVTAAPSTGNNYPAWTQGPETTLSTSTTSTSSAASATPSANAANSTSTTNTASKWTVPALLNFLVIFANRRGGGS